MKIIKEGNPNKNKPIRFECLNCDCIFEASIGECSKSGEYRNGIIYSCKCPCCRKTIYATDE